MKLDKNEKSQQEENNLDENISLKLKPKNSEIEKSKIENPKVNYSYSITSLNFLFQITVAIITCLSTFLDGYLLIFIGYNSTLLNQEWKVSPSLISLLEIMFHSNGALGGILSIPTCHFGNQIGMNFNLIFAISSIPITLLLYNTKSYSCYLFCISYICLSNGHLYNIGTNLIINKFSIYSRGSIFALIYFFNQFGKCFFSYLIYKYMESGILIVSYTIIPIFILFILQVIINLIMIMLYYEKAKSSIKKEKIIHMKYTGNYYSLQLYHYIRFSKNKNEKFEIYNWLIKCIIDLFIESPELHEIILVIINFTLGIQFYGMVTVFPLLKKPIPTIITNEIFFSKIFHTGLLGTFTLIFVLYTLNAKICLSIACLINLILNLSIMFNWFDSYWIIHFFRFVWNVSYVMCNLYCAEATLNKNRGTNTSFLYMIFKISCIIDILIVDKMVEMSLFFPIALDVFTLLFDIVLISKLKVETYFKNCQEIDMVIMANIHEGGNKNN